MHRYIAPTSAYCVDDGFDSKSPSTEDSDRSARKQDNTGEEVGLKRHCGCSDNRRILQIPQIGRAEGLCLG